MSILPFILPLVNLNMKQCVISSTSVDLFRNRLCELETICICIVININNMCVILPWRPVHYL